MKTKQFGITLACVLLLAAVAARDANAQPSSQTGSTPQNPIADPSSPLYGWEKYSSAEGRFSAIFPAQPKEQSVNSQAKDGEIHLVHYFQSPKDPHHIYQVGYFDLLRPNNDPKLLLAKVEEGMIDKEENPKIVFYKSFQIGNHPATEFEFAGGRHPNFSGRVRLILAGQRVYNLVTIFVTTEPKPDERSAFFDSFSLQQN